jgi:transcriptional regulator with XRE-family HTH domain
MQKSGEQLKKLRTRLGLAQAQFARIFKVHKQQICRMEQGEAILRDQYAKNMMALGLNPLFLWDDNQTMALPGYTFEQVCKNVEEATNGD